MKGKHRILFICILIILIFERGLNGDGALQYKYSGPSVLRFNSVSLTLQYKYSGPTVLRFHSASLTPRLRSVSST